MKNFTKTVSVVCGLLVFVGMINDNSGLMYISFVLCIGAAIIGALLESNKNKGV